MDVLVSEPFPEVYDIALICDRNHFLVGNSLADAWYELVKVSMDLVHPALAVSLVCGMRIDLGAYAYNARDHTGLRLRA